MRSRIVLVNPNLPVQGYKEIEIVSVPKRWTETFWDFLSMEWRSQIKWTTYQLASRLELFTMEVSREALQTEYVQTVVNYDDIVNQVWEHAVAIAETQMEWPSVVFIGGKVQHVFSLKIQDEYRPSLAGYMRDGRSPQDLFRGMQVINVPWLDGFFCWNPVYADFEPQTNKRSNSPKYGGMLQERIPDGRGGSIDITSW